MIKEDLNNPVIKRNKILVLIIVISGFSLSANVYLVSYFLVIDKMVSSDRKEEINFYNNLIDDYAEIKSKCGRQSHLKY